MIFIAWDASLAALFIVTILYETQQWFRFYFRYLVFYSVVMIAAVILIPIALFRPGDVYNTELVSYALGPILNGLLGMKWHLRFPENFVQDGSIIVANHQSSIDFVGMMTIWPTMKRCAAIAKKELNYAGPFGLVAWLCGTIFIERQKAKSSHIVLNQSGDIVKKKKLKLWIFPEGTRNSEEDMLPFKKGAFHLAITSQLPISPVVFSHYHFLDYKNKRFDPGEVIITVLPPISTKGLTLEQMPQLMNQTRTMMLDVFKSTSAESIIKM